MNRGEIWWADLPDPWGRRLILLLSRSDAYSLLNIALVAPLTTRLRRGPTFVPLMPDVDDVPAASVVSLDHVQVVYQSLIDRFVTTLSPEKMTEVDHAIHVALGLDD